jgi:hypothetical protein
MSGTKRNFDSSAPSSLIEFLCPSIRSLKEQLTVLRNCHLWTSVVAMAIARQDTPRCTPDDWNFLRCLVSNGMVFEVQDWIRSGHQTLRPLGVRTSLLGMAVDRQNHSMVRVLWESGWQEEEEAAASIAGTYNGAILRYLLESGCPVEELTAYNLCQSHDVEAMRFGFSRGVKLTGPDGWADVFVSTSSRPLIRFFLEEKDRIPDLKQEGVHALCMAIKQSRLRAAALLVWAGVDPLAQCSRWEAWDEPADTWDGCPAEYLSYSERGVEVMKLLKLNPTAEQWLRLLEHSRATGPVLDKIIALKQDARAIIENNPREATNILMGYFESACRVYCRAAGEAAAACARLMELGAIFAFREGDDPARMRRQIYASRSHSEIIRLLDFAWRRHCETTRNTVRELASKPRMKELVREYAPELAKGLGLTSLRDMKRDLPRWQRFTGARGRARSKNTPS